MVFVAIVAFNPLTAKISLTILVTVCYLTFMTLIWKIHYWIN